MTEDFPGLVRRPAAVRIEVDLGVLTEALTQDAYGLDVQGQWPAAGLELEGRYPVVVAEAQGLLKELRRGPEAEHVRDTHALGVSAEQLVHRGTEKFADQVPQGDVDR